MKIIKFTIIVVAFFLFCGMPEIVFAQPATENEALRVAENWVEAIILKTGKWGDANSAYVEGIQDFKRGGRKIGYFCKVQPVGYIIVSLRKELAPVKAFSSRRDLDPASEEGMADLLKGKMAGILDAIEQQAGPILQADETQVSNLLEIDYRGAWSELEGNVSQMELGSVSAEGDVGVEDYQEGQILLTMNWHQGDPFNRDCPAPPPGDDCTQARCVVGCVATAGAMIMRYWSWPPYGSGSPYNDTYDWRNMPDTVTGGSPAAEIAAVAELSHEIGIAVNMDYCGNNTNGCQSSAYTYDMEGVYQSQYRYDTQCDVRYRPDYSAVDWFNLIKNELNANRPIQYRILGHSIVCDGWLETGSTPTRQYHMNYGWSGTTDDTWYTLDALYHVGGGTTSDEYLVREIYPVQAIGSSLAVGIYSKPAFPYRYFYRDATGSATTFSAGQYLQFLPRIKLTSNGLIRFEGLGTDSTRLFTRGDSSTGIRIYDGALVMYGTGSIKFH